MKCTRKHSEETARTVNLKKLLTERNLNFSEVRVVSILMCLLWAAVRPLQKKQNKSWFYPLKDEEFLTAAEHCLNHNAADTNQHQHRLYVTILSSLEMYFSTNS